MEISLERSGPNRLEYNRSKADVCLLNKCVNRKLILWIVLVDNYLFVSPKKEVIKANNNMKQLFDFTEVGGLKEYVGAKINHNKEEHWMKCKQQVLR